MKKTMISLVLAVVLSMAFLSVCVAEDAGRIASAEMEPFSVDSETMAKLGVASGEQVVKYYTTDIVYAFGECEDTKNLNIPDLISKYSFESVPGYLILSGGKLDRVVFVRKGGELSKAFPVEELTENVFDHVVREALEPKALQSAYPDIAVKNLYLFDADGRPWDGAAVYYETDRGNFVYFDHWTGEYLFPVEKFVEVMKAERAQRGPDTPPGETGSVLSTLDLSLYDIHSEQFHPALGEQGASHEGNNHVTSPSSEKTGSVHWYWLACGAVIIVGGAICGFFAWKNKKNAHAS